MSTAPREKSLTCDFPRSQRAENIKGCESSVRVRLSLCQEPQWSDKRWKIDTIMRRIPWVWGGSHLDCILERGWGADRTATSIFDGLRSAFLWLEPIVFHIVCFPFHLILESLLSLVGGHLSLGSGEMPAMTAPFLRLLGLALCPSRRSVLEKASCAARMNIREHLEGCSVGICPFRSVVPFQCF